MGPSMLWHLCQVNKNWPKIIVNNNTSWKTFEIVKVEKSNSKPNIPKFQFVNLKF